MSEVRPWDEPVVSALDEVETLPGFAPDHVEWDYFRFYGEGMSGPMDTTSIYAFPATSGRSEFVRFAATDDGFTMTDPDHHHLTPPGVARALDVPIESAEQAATALGAALTTALARFNTSTAAGIDLDESYVPAGPARPEDREIAQHINGPSHQPLSR